MKIKKKFPLSCSTGRKTGLAIAVLATLTSVVTTTKLSAGDFDLDWSVIDWPAGALGPFTYVLKDQYGFEVDTTIQAFGTFASYGTPSPNDDTIFGGNVESLVVVSDAPFGQANIGDATVSSSISFSSGGIAFPVDGLKFRVVDIDASDNNNASDRCDFITVTGDNGNPTLSAVSATPVVLVGPGPGTGATGTLASNQAQCIYVDGIGVSPTSPNDDTGTVLASFPNNTSSATIFYDESIGNVRPFFLGEDPAPRGGGFFSEAGFNVAQTISLARTVTPTTGTEGESVTYQYDVTNTGGLPFNTGQDIVIEDSLLGTVTCPAITAPVAPGGTVTCTAPYTITAADVVAGSVNSSATAGIGTIGQPFASRLQSTSQAVALTTVLTPAPPAPLTCTTRSVFSQPQTQLAGPGTASSPTTSDVYLYDNVTTDTSGNQIDIVMRLEQISNAINVDVSTGMLARMVPADNGFVTYSLRLVQDGTATPANPLGTAIEQSSINGIIVQQTDVDSRGAGDDSSDVVGTLQTPTDITHFNTAVLPSFPTGGNAIAMDPAKTGDPTNWIDEPNETDFDNYATYEFDTFVEATFIHGYTGTSLNAATRGSGILLCAISNTSATVVAEDDDYTATPINTLAGGTAGEVMSNDTINGLPAAFPTATLDVISTATPANTGDPVPTLETTGPDAGRVIVPVGVPAGVYFIEYRLCDAVNPDDCDRAKVTVSVYDGNGFDFGDAPVSYLTASHAVPAVPNLYLGAIAPDAEVIAQSDATATADDLLDIDDEDGVTFPVLTQGANTTLDVSVTGLGNLQAWIDFNGDGVFEDALGERIAVDLRDDGTSFDNIAGDGVIQIDVTVPVDATTDVTFARFRYSTNAALSPTSFAADGEAEDYSLTIAAADLVDRGDAPASYGAPRHVIVPSIYLGAAEPDSDILPIYSAGADADDLTDNNDEDGVAAFPIFEAGSTVSLTVVTHETMSDANMLLTPLLRSPGITNLQVWVDFDQNGIFDTSEQVAIDYRDGGTGDTDGIFNNQISLDISVPANIGNGISYARLRWSTSSGVTSNPFDGLNLDGEVEDYVVTLSNPGGPLVCDTGFFMVFESANQPILEKLQITGSPGSYAVSRTTYPPDFASTYSTTGWGWSEVDNYIYGIFRNSFDLYRVTYSGAVEFVVNMDSLGLGQVGSTTEILPNGVMVYNILGQSGQYQLLDISDPVNPVNLGILDAGVGAPNGLDMGYNPRDGLLYMVVNGNDIYAMDPLSGTAGATTTVLVASNVTLPAGTGSYQLDSVWMDENGYFYAYDNTSRQIFVAEVGGAGARPATFEFFKVDGTGSAPIGNDGASCRKGAFYASTVFAEGAITGTLYNDVNASGTFDPTETGVAAEITVRLYDDAGTPADPSDDTLVNTTQSATDGTYLFDFVNATATYRIEVDSTDPDIPAGQSIGTANPITGVNVGGGATTAAQDFGFVDGPQTIDLSITKAAFDTSGGTIASAIAGTAFDFVLTVQNDGPGNATGVQVIDVMPDGFTYVTDDAASQGTSYDSSTGLWNVGALSNGASTTLTIRVTMNATGDHTNLADIVAADQADSDSDPRTGVLTDDLSDGIADDDEASITVVLDTGERLLSGSLFLDNGINGGTPHDATVNGSEVGTQSAVLSILDGSGSLIANPTIAADGSWAYALDGTYSGSLTITASPLPGLITVSENSTGLPSLINSDPHDGSYTFTPDANSNYSGLDLGLVTAPTLTRDQEASVESGQVVALRHEYTAFTSGTVDFSYANPAMSPANSFGATLFRDADCDGTPESAINGPITVSAGDRICLVSRVAANSGIGPGSSYTYDLIATTSLTGTTIVSTSKNTDRIVASGGAGQLELSKTVRNVTQNTPEGASNGGAIGDILQYRIYLKNPSSSYATDVTIYDQTPAYTVLAGPIATPVALGADLTCVVAQPTNNVAGYAGALRWNCTGTYPPGELDYVQFDVQISP